MPREHARRGRGLPTCARRVVAALVVAAALAPFVAPAHAAAHRKARRPRPGAALAARVLYGHNLITNGDAEIESGGFAPGWKPDETLEAEVYGHTASEWDWDVEGAPGGGVHYFRLPVPSGAESIVVDQWIAVAAESAAIDRGQVDYRMSGWLGGLIDGPGVAVLSAVWFDGAGAALGTIATEPVPAARLPRPRLGLASLAEQSLAGPLPKGTRRIHVALCARNAGFAQCSDCNALGLADRLALVLTRNPTGS